jgi:ABC-type bacteriocin/lantibiotic exporter with double-glycine peptidase domain
MPVSRSAVGLATTSLKQRKAMCGPTCLRMVAGYFGIAASAKQIARICRSSPISGTTGANMLKGARRLGLASKLVDHANFAMIESWLRKGVPVIVDWMSAHETGRSGERTAVGHYSVVCGLTRSHIIVDDPEIGQRRRMTRRQFLNVWFDFKHRSPRTKDDLVIRRLIVVGPEELLSKSSRNPPKTPTAAKRQSRAQSRSRRPGR